MFSISESAVKFFDHKICERNFNKCQFPEPIHQNNFGVSVYNIYISFSRCLFQMKAQKMKSTNYPCKKFLNHLLNTDKIKTK